MLAIPTNHYKEITRERKSTLKLNAYNIEVNLSVIYREILQKMEDYYENTKRVN